MDGLRLLLPPVMLCLSMCDVSLDDSAAGRDGRVRLACREPREAVQAILAAEMTPEDRMRALEPYINVGRSQEEVERVLGHWFILDGHGPGFDICDYGKWDKPGLRVEYYPDGEVCAIMYRTKDGKQVDLRSDDPITWPKTIDGKNALLRLKTK